MTEGSGIPTLETENYRLRGMTLADAPSLFVIMSDTKTMMYITPHPVQTLDEMEAKIMDQLANFQKTKEIPWVIIKKDSDNVIGMFRFHKLHMWHMKAEMGAVLHQDYQRQGVMTEILGIILPYGFNKLGLNRIVGDIFAENKSSQTLLEKYHFHQDGILRQTDFDGETFHDTVVYSLLKAEFNRKPETTSKALDK